MPLNDLVKELRAQGVDIFPEDDSHCYIEGELGITKMFAQCQMKTLHETSTKMLTRSLSFENTALQTLVVINIFPLFWKKRIAAVFKKGSRKTGFCFSHSRLWYSLLLVISHYVFPSLRQNLNCSLVPSTRKRRPLPLY